MWRALGSKQSQNENSKLIITDSDKLKLHFAHVTLPRMTRSWQVSYFRVPLSQALQAKTVNQLGLCCAHFIQQGCQAYQSISSYDLVDLNEKCAKFTGDQLVARDAHRHWPSAPGQKSFLLFLIFDKLKSLLVQGCLCWSICRDAQDVIVPIDDDPRILERYQASLQHTHTQRQTTRDSEVLMHIRHYKSLSDVASIDLTAFASDPAPFAVSCRGRLIPKDAKVLFKSSWYETYIFLWKLHRRGTCPSWKKRWLVLNLGRHSLLSQ